MEPSASPRRVLVRRLEPVAGHELAEVRAKTPVPAYERLALRDGSGIRKVWTVFLSTPIGDARDPSGYVLTLIRCPAPTCAIHRKPR